MRQSEAEAAMGFMNWLQMSHAAMSAVLIGSSDQPYWVRNKTTQGCEYQELRVLGHTSDQDRIQGSRHSDAKEDSLITFHEAFQGAFRQWLVRRMRYTGQGWC